MPRLPLRRPKTKRTMVGASLLTLGLVLLAAAGAFYAYTAIATSNLDQLVVQGDDPAPTFATLRGGGGAEADAPPPDAGALYPGSVMSYRQWADPRGTLDLGQEPLLEGFTPIAAVGQPSFAGDIGRADRLIIPALEIDSTVQDLAILDLGDSRAYETPYRTVGHIPGTPNPGSHGNGWYFGHLESPVQQEGNVFVRLPQIPGLLRDGEDVFVIAQSGGEQYLYLVTQTDILHQDDLRLYQAGDSRITLVACQPRGTYDHRLLVTAKLVGFRSAPEAI